MIKIFWHFFSFPWASIRRLFCIAFN